MTREASAPDADAAFGRTPLLPHERQYSTIGVLATGFASAVATWCFLIGGYAALHVNAVQGVVTLLAGCVVGVAFSAIGSALACNRYGVEQLDFTKLVFGQRGAHVVMVFYVIGQLGWTGLILVLSGSGLRSIAEAMGVSPGPLLIRGVTLAGIALAFLIAARGISILDRFNRLLTPLLVVTCVTLFVLLFRRHGLGAILAAPPIAPFPDRDASYMLAFEFGLGAGFSWWPGIGFLARNARSQRASFYPQVLTMGLAMGLVCCAPLFAALVYRDADPTQWMLPLAGTWGGCAILALLALANISASAVMMYCAGLALRHVPALRTMQWRDLQLIAFVPVLAFAVAPDALYAKGSTFLAYNATMYAPLSSILLVEYLLLRRRRFNLSQLYESAPSGDYFYTRGYNVFAMLNLGLSLALYLWLLDPATSVYRGPFPMVGASIPVLLFSGLFHYGSVKLLLQPSGRGGYGADPRARPLQSPNL